MHPPFFRTKLFWLFCLGVAVVLAVLYAWELGLLPLPSPSRPEPTLLEMLFAAVLLLILSICSGLLAWHSAHRGSCPIGAKRAGSIAGALGALALLCPACTVIPLALFGTTIGLSVLGPFVPLLKIIALFLALITLFLLWPRKQQ